jgi:hypothetical protein
MNKIINILAVIIVSFIFFMVFYGELNDRGLDKQSPPTVLDSIKISDEKFDIYEKFPLTDINLSPLYLALYEVESSKGTQLIGDNGRSIGPYQISKPYWVDAVNHDVSLLMRLVDGVKETDDWFACFDDEYSEKVMYAYWDRYAPDDVNYEILARIHNGGPKGYNKESTIKYWKKVETILNRDINE